MTAHAMKGDRERCLAAGMDGYVSKPIQPRELHEALERAAPAGPEVVPPPAAAVDGVDLSAALARVGDDPELLAEITGLFLDGYPNQMDELREAVARGDAATVQRLPIQSAARSAPSAPRAPAKRRSGWKPWASSDVTHAQRPARLSKRRSAPAARPCRASRRRGERGGTIGWRMTRPGQAAAGWGAQLLRAFAAKSSALRPQNRSRQSPLAFLGRPPESSSGVCYPSCNRQQGRSR